MKAITLLLEPYQQITLEQMSRHHPKPYLREKAAALLKVAAGQSVAAVARQGLLQTRNPDTVRGWIHAYQRFGLGGLYHAPRRRRAFSPSAGGRAEGPAV